MVDEDEKQFDERFKSSRDLNLWISSGNVMRLLPDKSKDFNLLRGYKFLILTGATQLYDKFKTSSFGKSSGARIGIFSILLYCKLRSMRAFKFFNYSILTLLSDNSKELRF